MEDRLSWLSAILGFAGWLLLAVLVLALGWWAWRNRRYRSFLKNGAHGLATIAFGLAFVIATSRVGNTSGFGAWNLIPLILGRPPLAVVLLVWGLVARARSDDESSRRAALVFSFIALLPLLVIASMLLGSV